MTWTKLGDEFGPEVRDLTDAEFRTHVEALCWSNWRLLDLRIPKRDVARFAESADAAAAIDGLIVKGWWEDRGDVWHIGLRFPEWQRDRAQVESRRAYLAEAQRRSRKHKAGDHSECLPAARCRSTVDETVDSTVDPGRVGTGPNGPSRPVDLKTGNPSSPNVSRAGGEVDGEKDGCVANSQNRRVHDASEYGVLDAQQIPIEVQLQSQATDRYAREHCPACDRLIAVTATGGMNFHKDFAINKRCRGVGQLPRPNGQVIAS